MRKVISLLLLVLIVSGAMLAAGCREPALDYEALIEGKKKGEVKVKTDAGETTYTKGVDEEELGAPIYPGAEIDEETTQTMNTSGEQGQLGLASAGFRTADPITEVIAWYKKELSGKTDFKDMSSTAAGSEVGMFSFKTGDRSVNINITKDKKDPEKTTISIISGTGQKGTVP